MKRKVKLQWNVLRYDFNSKKVINYNIFGQEFAEEIYKKIARKKEITNFNELKEYIKSWAMYRYWAKCEYEIFVGCFLSKEDEFKKIDIYSQIEMNLDRITEYVINEMKIDFGG